MSDEVNSFEAREETIGGIVFRVVPMPSRLASKLLVRLGHRAAASVEALLSQLGGAKSLADLDLAAVGSAIRRFLEGLDEKDIDALRDAFDSRTEFSYDGERWPKLAKLPPNVDPFAARQDIFWGWIWFCLKVNYASFLDERSAFASALSGAQEIAREMFQPKAPAPRPSTSTSPTESTGSSTA